MDAPSNLDGTPSVVPQEFLLSGEDPELVEMEDEAKLVMELWKGGKPDWDAPLTDEERALMKRAAEEHIPGLGGGKPAVDVFPDIIPAGPGERNKGDTLSAEEIRKRLFPVKSDDVEGLVDVPTHDDNDDDTLSVKSELDGDPSKKADRATRRKNREEAKKKAASAKKAAKASDSAKKS